MKAEKLDIKVIMGDLQSDEKWEDTLEGARTFLLDLLENNPPTEEEEPEEDEITYEEHLENVREADYDGLNRMLSGVGYYIEKL